MPIHSNGKKNHSKIDSKKNNGGRWGGEVQQAELQYHFRTPDLCHAVTRTPTLAFLFSSSHGALFAALPRLLVLLPAFSDQIYDILILDPQALDIQQAWLQWLPCRPARVSMASVRPLVLVRALRKSCILWCPAPPLGPISTPF